MREACQDDLVWVWEAYREFTVTLDVLIRGMTFGANESEQVVPSQRRHHVLGSQINSPIRFASPNHDQWRDRKKPIPDR